MYIIVQNIEEEILNASWRHQQSFHDVRWSWCADRGHEDPSSASDHDGSCVTISSLVNDKIKQKLD